MGKPRYKSFQEMYYFPAEAFHKEMVKYLDEYTEHLLLVKGGKTSVSSHTIIQEFINYLFNEHLIANIEHITVLMANSQFYKCYQKLNPELLTDQEIKHILKDFFLFIYGKHGLSNGKLMKGFERGIKKG